MPKSEITGSQMIYILSFIYTATFSPQIVSICNLFHNVREFWFPQTLTHTFQYDVYVGLNAKNFRTHLTQTHLTHISRCTKVQPRQDKWAVHWSQKTTVKKIKQPSTQLEMDLFLSMLVKYYTCLSPFNPFWRGSSFSNLIPSI